MSCGAGRGRGWLNLKKTTNTSSNLGEPHNSPPAICSPNENLYENAEYSKYADLIKAVSILSTKADGILLNRLINNVLTCWNDSCSTPEDVQQSFDSVYSACLCNEELAVKFILLASSNAYKDAAILGVNLRKLFLESLQKSFEERVTLQKSSPQKFRNVVLMISEFGNRYQKFRFLVPPVIALMKMLMDTATLADCKLFTTQFCLIDAFIKQFDEYNDLLIKVRETLIFNEFLTKDCKLWLMLALDYSNGNCDNLKLGVFQFYEKHLDKSINELQKADNFSPKEATNNFQKADNFSPKEATNNFQPSDLSIQTTHESKILDNFKSNVNVLQLSTTEASPNNSEISSITNRSPVGRPILGSGARFNRKPSDDNSRRNNSQKTDYGNGSAFDARKNVYSKGWEHDDRFDTDYS